MPKCFEQGFITKWIKIGHIIPIQKQLLQSEILVNENNEVCFLCKSLQTLFFNEHFFAFKVIEQNKVFSVTLEDLLYHL